MPTSFREVSGSRSLRAHAQRHGLTFGSAVIIRNVQDDPDFAALIRGQCGIVVPTNELKWIALRPGPDKFDFERPDFLLAFAQRNHMLIRGHTLCWHESVPDWIKAPEFSGNVREIFADHITTVCKHFAGRLHSWDVVNEAILPADGEARGLRKSFWYERVGPDYVELAFRTARAADPHVRLTYNDYGVELESPEDAGRRRLILDLLRNLKRRDVPIDAVGIQSHVKAAQPYGFGKGLSDYIEAIRQMGLEVYLTELDVNEDDITTDDPTARDAIIARTYRDFLRVALANPAVKVVLTWDLSDRFTWLNSGPTHHRKQQDRPQRSLPFDRDYRPKSAFFAIRDCFDQRTTVA
jgi:endo-1,4-beta-xylanase